MNKLLLFVLMALLLTASVSAQERESVSMKTTDYYLLEFEVGNVNNLDLTDCVPYLGTSDYEIKDYADFQPERFELAPGDRQHVVMRIDSPPEGYYEAEVNVKCARYKDGEFIDVADIIDPNAEPQYEILVTPAGAGQSYVFIPGKSYNFIARPGTDESASFTIANAGTSPLDVSFDVPFNYTGQITFTPRTLTVGAGQRKLVKVEVAIPSDFESMDTVVAVNIGDYAEDFVITGTKESLNFEGGAVATNIITGGVNVGSVKIPNWILIPFLVLGIVLMAKGQQEKNAPKKKKPKRRKKR